jgi:hypothetical protein
MVQQEHEEKKQSKGKNREKMDTVEEKEKMDMEKREDE